MSNKPSNRGGRHVRQPDPVSAPKKTGKKIGTAVIIIIAVLAVAILAGGYALFHHFYGLMGSNKTGDFSGASLDDVIAEEIAREQGESDDFDPDATAAPTPTPTPRPLTEEEIAAQEEAALSEELQSEAEEVMYSDDVYNILLIGSDGRTETLERSDSMILVSINKSTKKIWITSFMRDTQVSIMKEDGSFWGTGHLNWATRFGGVDYLIATLESEKNFGIHVDNWAMVDFIDFVDVADLLGPVTVTVESKAEAKDIDRMIREACKLYDLAYGLTDTENSRYRDYFRTEGTFTVTDGAKILGYCRERHYGGDTGRSEKQRDVLVQFFNNIKNMSLKQQYELLEKCFSIVTTDLTEGECISLMLQLPQLISYEIETQQCPTPGAFWKGRDNNNLSIYNADFTTNRNFLRATIYGEQMTTQQLTSSWTGKNVLVWWPPENNE